MTTTNDKLRSLFLAALMVFSVFAMTVALPGSAAANHEAQGDDADAHLNSGDTYWQGQKLWFQDSQGSQGDTYQVREYDRGEDEVGSLQTEITLDQNQSAVIDEDSLDGDYIVEDPNGNVLQFSNDGTVAARDTNPANLNSPSWEVTTQNLDADFEDNDVTTDTNDNELTIDSNRGSYNITVDADGDLSGDELNDIFSENYTVTDVNNDDDEITIEDPEGSFDTDFTGVDTGEYTFNFEVTDTSASASDTVNVSEAPEGDVDFSEDVVQEQTGDIADITVEMENSEAATLVIGSAEQNYWLIADVEDGNDDGEVTVQFNTFAAGAGAPTDFNKVSAADSDDSVTVTDEGGSYTNNNEVPADKILDTTEYDMNLTQGAGADVTDADEVGTLSLQDRSTDSISSWTAPSAEDVPDWDAEDVAAGVGTNLTEADDIVMDDYAVFQVQASGIEGALANASEDPSVLNSNETSFEIEHTNPGANADADTINLGSDNVSVVNDGNNDTYYVVLETAATDNLTTGGEYEANFSVNAGSELNTADDEAESVTDDFSIVEADSSLDTNEDDMVLVEAADNQTISGESNLAPGTEMRVKISSDDSTSPFLTRPEATVQSDGTLEFTADFSELAAGTNLTLEFEGDDYDGQVVEEGSLGNGENETETPTPEPDTETPTPEPDTETPTPEPDTETPTEEPDTDTPTDDSGPGFTVVAALGALIAAALLAVRRND